MVQQVQTSLFFKLADPVCRQILSYTPKTSLFLTAKKFSQLQEKAKETEWKRLKARVETVVFATEHRKSACEGMVLRARQIEWNKPFTSDFFQKLYEGQKEEATQTAMGRYEFARVGTTWKHYFGPERFEAAESVVLIARDEIDSNLEKLWLHLATPLHGPPLEHASEIRAWLKDPANEDSVNGIRKLKLEFCNFTVLPLELAQCKNLKTLKLANNQISDFPALKGLQQLEYIDLQYNHLNYVPQELLDLPHLNREGVCLSDNPLKVLPEKLYDKFYTWLYWLSSEPIDGNPYNSCLNEWFGYEGHLQFSTYALEEIPFSMWLRKRLWIPNLGEHFFAWVDAILGKIHPKCDCSFLPMPILTGISILVFLSLWVPCYLINRLLALLAVPAITKIRELFGYGRMIRINVGEL